MRKILLITGWGVGIEPLQALQQQLSLNGYATDLINIFDALDPLQLDQHLTQVEHYDILMGWSLGGQLATVLAQHYLIKTGIAKTLVTLGSNPCFVQNAAWPNAMSIPDFQNFKQSYRDHAQACIKRFCYLISQVDTDTESDAKTQTKKNWISLQSLMIQQDELLMQQGLQLLQQLNLVTILQNYRGQQFHLFAAYDTLVDCKVTEFYKEFLIGSSRVAIIDAAHGFPIFNVSETTEQLLHMLNLS